MTPPADRSGVGFAGCPSGRGRLLKVRMADRRRKRLQVACPHCHGEVHETRAPHGRPLRPGEACELVEAPEVEDTPREGAEPSGDHA